MRWVFPVLLVLATSGGGVSMYAQHVLYRPGPLPEARAFVVPHGGLGQVADALRADGVIARRTDFIIAAWVTRREGSLHAAELLFPAHASLREVLSTLRTARPVQHSLTIPEGLTARQIVAIFAHAEALAGPVAEAPPEGGVLPQTYHYEYGTPPAAILARAGAAMDRAVAQEWDARAPGLPLASAREALILASIVERETALPDERPRVAEVFLNRLRRGMRLQSDPTVVFAVSGGAGPLDHPLTRADLDRDDPFNTYRIHGLPPGPICAPGLASLRAVLHPAAGDDLYFVADGTGRHVFARTLEEHARNVARWRAVTH
jgi:UPF0755 protein